MSTMAPPRLAAAEEELRLAAEEELLQLIDLMAMPMVSEQQQAAASKARALVEDLAGPRLPALPSAAELAAGFRPRRASFSLLRLALALLVTSKLMLLLDLIVLASAAWPALYARYPAVLAAWVLASSGMAALAIVCIVIARSRERTTKEVA